MTEQIANIANILNVETAAVLRVENWHQVVFVVYKYTETKRKATFVSYKNITVTTEETTNQETSNQETGNNEPSKTTKRQGRLTLKKWQREMKRFFNQEKKAALNFEKFTFKTVQRLISSCAYYDSQLGPSNEKMVEVYRDALLKLEQHCYDGVRNITPLNSGKKLMQFLGLAISDFDKALEWLDK